MQEPPAAKSPHVNRTRRTGSASVAAAAGRPGRIRLGRVAGVEIGLDYSWFIIFALVLLAMGTGYLPHSLPTIPRTVIWVLALLTTLLFFASVLAHELAHSIVARLNGMPVEGIDLFIFGGVAKLDEEPRTSGQEFVMAIVGPLASFLLAAIFLALWVVLRPTIPPLAVAAGYLAWLNFLLGAFNLVPGFPLDGGRVLRSIIWYRTGNLRLATRIATNVGQFVGYALIFLGIAELLVLSSAGGIWMAFIGWFLLQAAQAGYQQLLVRESIAGVKVGEIMSATPPIIPGSISVQEAIDNYFVQYPANIFPVVEGDSFLGIISVEEIRNIDRDARYDHTVASLVRPIDPDHIVAPNDAVATALGKLTRHGGGLLVVVEDDRFVGILSQQELLRLVQLRLQLGY